MSDPITLSHSDLPALYFDVSKASERAQRTFTRSLRIQLILICVAAAGGALTFQANGVDWAGVVAAVAFFSTAVIEGYILATKPNKVWYSSRAATESVKTLAWRYAVMGIPFDSSQKADATDRLFLQRVQDVLDGLKGLALVAHGEQRTQITTGMRALREASLSDRKNAYLSDRVENQQAWYLDKSKVNADRASRWRLIMLGTELVGGTLAIFKAISVVPLDLLGVTAAIVVAGGTWLQSKQHQTLATAYAVAAQELASIRSLVDSIQNDHEWSAFVEDAEKAISREHTMWRASRGPSPRGLRN